MPDVVIRKMAERDLMEIVALEKEIFADPWSYEAFRTDIQNPMAFPLAAVIGESIAGYSCLYIVAGEMQIGNFAVAPDHRGRGIAKLLMNRILEIAKERECDLIFLEVRESNQPARSLYESYEFKVVGRRVGYYRNPYENAILMTREL
ncbi:MAG: ribosomal-protein-alanine N-acetyltransferase [candidate division Zixibacteria bacterium RBG_16_53_22]|nr:MAG: ribosomal-protein-alanine N-acetyltransferase [candidate division Zixibacteria bacterium RBG_16_53_22]